MLLVTDVAYLFGGGITNLGILVEVVAVEFLLLEAVNNFFPCLNNLVME